MKFNDLAALSKKDAEDNESVEALKQRYLELIAKQKVSFESLKSLIVKKFDEELKSILDMNQEIKHHTENDVVYIRFEGGNISIQVRNRPINADFFSVKKEFTFNRGDKTDFKFIELSPVFPHEIKITKPESFVNSINQGDSFNTSQIQDMKREIRVIEKNIETLSTVPKLKYYVHKGSKLGNGNINENESLELMLDQAIATSHIFK